MNYFRDILNEVLGKESFDSNLVIKYSDIHPYHGGIAFELKGSGELVRHIMPKGQELTTESAIISQSRIKELVALLISIDIWVQKDEEHECNPDESKTQFSVTVYNQELYIWEWYNSMDKNNCLVQVLAFLQKAFTD